MRRSRKPIKVLLNKKQRRLVHAFLLVFGDRVKDVSPFMMETALVLAIVGEPDKFMNQEDWQRYHDYCVEWNLDTREGEIRRGKCTGKHQLVPGGPEVSGL